MLVVAVQNGYLLAQNYDGHKSDPSEQVTVAESVQTDMNGGMPAVLMWAVPLVVALVFIVYVMRMKRGRMA